MLKTLDTIILCARVALTIKVMYNYYIFIPYFIY